MAFVYRTPPSQVKTVGERGDLVVGGGLSVCSAP